MFKRCGAHRPCRASTQCHTCEIGKLAFTIRRSVCIHSMRLIAANLIFFLQNVRMMFQRILLKFSVWLFFPKSSYENTQKWKQKEKVMESQESVLLWSRNNALVFTSFVVAPPCCFVGIFREMISSYQTDVSMHILLKNLSQISMSQCLNPLFPTSLFSLAYGKLSANLVLFSTNSWNWKERLLVL